MKSINMPTKMVTDILNILKTDTTRNSIHLDIDSVVDVLAEREAIYLNKVYNNTLFEIARDTYISERVDKVKMISYYEYRILEKPKGREFYDQMILSAPHNICPYCTIRTVKNLDHYLPKSEYPSYSITPSNLVPSCRDCNTDKKVTYPTNSEDQTFHPYFDSVDSDEWINAELKHSEPLSFQYKLKALGGWDNKKMTRASHHFVSYNINELFSNEADRELRGMQRRFKDLYSKDKIELENHLKETYISCRDGLGILDWKTLMYKELMNNNWFLNGCNGTDFFN